MKTVYMDRLSHSEPVSVFVRNINIKWAGASVYSMPVSDKNAVYQNIADKYDVHFIFDDEKPELHFYSVPWVEVFAIDSCGGCFSSVEDLPGFDSKSPVVYIDGNKKVFWAAEDFEQFIGNLINCKDNMKPYSEVRVFDTKEDAMKIFEFIEVKTDEG